MCSWQKLLLSCLVVTVSVVLLLSELVLPLSLACLVELIAVLAMPCPCVLLPSLVSRNVVGDAVVSSVMIAVEVRCFCCCALLPCVVTVMGLQCSCVLPKFAVNLIAMLCLCALPPALDAVVALPEFVVNVVSLLCRCVPLLVI